MVSAKPTPGAAFAISGIIGVMSWRGHLAPYFTTASWLPPKSSGVPPVSPKNSMSITPRSATRARSS